LSNAGTRWEQDVTELEGLVRPNTTLIILTVPSNPTGAVTTRPELERIVDIAKRQSIMVMCDEVFRFLHHNDQATPPPSLLELGYDYSVVTGSISKAFALPGVRCGWIASSPQLRHTVFECIAQTRDYTTIAVSQVDQSIAAFALADNVRSQILHRSSAICRHNFEKLSSWALRNRAWVDYIPPSGGGTCVMRIRDRAGKPVDDSASAAMLAHEERVCVPPAGLCFGHEADGSGETDMQGFRRIGIVMSGDVLDRGLQAIKRLRIRT